MWDEWLSLFRGIRGLQIGGANSYSQIWQYIVNLNGVIPLILAHCVAVMKSFMHEEPVNMETLFTLMLKDALLLEIGCIWFPPQMWWTGFGLQMESLWHVWYSFVRMCLGNCHCTVQMTVNGKLTCWCLISCYYVNCMMRVRCQCLWTACSKVSNFQWCGNPESWNAFHAPDIDSARNADLITLTD